MCIVQVFGLQMAITKTEDLFQRPKTQPDLPDPQIFIDSTKLQVVNNFKYFGSHIDIIDSTKTASFAKITFLFLLSISFLSESLEEKTCEN